MLAATTKKPAQAFCEEKLFLHLRLSLPLEDQILVLDLSQLLAAFVENFKKIWNFIIRP